MNKQRKVLITTTYNEMGIIIDTKAEELGSSAQPEIIRCKDCNHLFNKDDEGGKCWHFNGFSKVVSYDDFCSRAERRTNG